MQISSKVISHAINMQQKIVKIKHSKLSKLNYYVSNTTITTITMY